MQFDTLLFEVQDHLAHITLNRPQAVNSINREFSKDLMHAVLRCDEDPDIRAVLISGAGNLFCAGGDLKDFHTRGADLPYYLKETTSYLHAAISRLIRMDPPVVAAVHGYAVGAGMSLALACDMVFAAQSAQFSVAYTRVGLTPDGSMSYILPRVVGLRKALELTLTNRMLTAQEALDWGLINRVVADADLMKEAKGIALQLASGPPKSFGAAKRLLHGGWTETLETQMEEESQTIADMTRTLDTREGISAFLEKRTPRYKGQ